jgi:hypothetical protein
MGFPDAQTRTDRLDFRQANPGFPFASCVWNVGKAHRLVDGTVRGEWRAAVERQLLEAGEVPAQCFNLIL